MPMVLLVGQACFGRRSPRIPGYFGRISPSRRRRHDFLTWMRPHIERLEATIHARHEGWITGVPLRLLHAAFSLMVVVLALPIPLDNLFAAWAILFFCLALLERDGMMAMLGWLMTVVALVWTAALLILGPLVVLGVIKGLF